MLGVNNDVVMKRKGQRKKGHKKDVKVTYISSPMKVKTSASNFRALVQELTGQASNVAEMFVEADYDVHKDISAQQWTSESSWLKPHDYNNQLHSSSSMDPLDAQFQYQLLGFDMI